jgi:hypothetical protein
VATAAEIARVRTLVDVTVSDFSDAAVTLAIELYPIRDVDGYVPSDDDWTATYDLYLAAADIAEQRAAKVITQYDTNTDGFAGSRSQMQAQLYALATRLRARARAPVARADIPDPAITEDEDEWT